MFDCIVLQCAAIDPSLDWNGQELVLRAAEFIDRGAALDVALFLATSSEEGAEGEGIRRFTAILDAAQPSGLRWNLTPLVAESHGSIPLPAVYQGLPWIFAGWDIEAEAEALFDDAPAEQIFEAVDALYRSSGERFGLERDAPYSVFESLLSFLADNGRLAEAAELTLRHADRYPLSLVPNVIAGIAQLFVEAGNREAAIAYLADVLEIYPENETAKASLDALGPDPSE